MEKDASFPTPLREIKNLFYGRSQTVFI